MSAPSEGVGGFPASLGYDPAKPSAGPPQKDAMNKRIDLPPEAYALNPLDFTFPKRPSFNESGKPANVEVNQFRLTKIDTSRNIYQYDIAISPMPTKGVASVFAKCWKSNPVQDALKETKVRWLYDGRKLAWSPVLVDRGELRIKVDLDEGRKVKPESQGKNVFHVTIRKTKELRISVLPAYLRGQMGWDDSILEVMNFLDHVLRQGPSERLTAIRRNFYNPKSEFFPLDDLVSANKGIYSSIRMNQSINQGGLGLGLNVDVSNTAFWSTRTHQNRPATMIDLILNLLASEDRRHSRPEARELANFLRPVKDRHTGRWVPSEAFKTLRKLYRLHFNVNHRKDDKDYIIFKFEFKEEYGPEGATANSVTFDQPDGSKISIKDYMQQKYNYTLHFPNLPLIMTSRAGYFPAEVCVLKPMQLYNFKLDPDQTAKMIKFAVTRPEQRKSDIMRAKESLDWQNDPYLRQYGIQMDTRFAQVPARVLPNPEIKFQNEKINPGVSGRWDLRGKKFLEPNAHPLRSWAFVGLERSIDFASLQAFAGNFRKIYTGHGGTVTEAPLVLDYTQMPNVAEALQRAYGDVMKKYGNCQIIFCVVRAKNSAAWQRLKKSADCRFGILTQVLQGSHVKKNQAQYLSNVCMKVNAKLGGVTCKVLSTSGNPNLPAFFSRPTMIIGADVSHASPGANMPSMAAMTMSINKDATRYAAACQTNGYRVEMFSPSNIHACLGQLIVTWQKNCGVPPQHVYYFRDGVSEGQFVHVIQFEVEEMKRWFAAKGVHPKFTVIVATKRHHIRFFPQQGDRNKNALPGTLVEKEVTHPLQWDFYLCSHVAIQGTARPVHYHVILDEANCKPEDLQKMIYQQCYQYIRSTTPVSLHPAVYYAHLASLRAREHENISVSDGFRTGGKAVEVQTDMIAKGIALPGPDPNLESVPLLPMGGSADAIPLHRDNIRGSMWYI